MKNKKNSYGQENQLHVYEVWIAFIRVFDILEVEEKEYLDSLIDTHLAQTEKKTQNEKEFT